MSQPRVLTIAGSDPSGGAGVQADLKTFAAWRCYGMAVVTVLTCQNTVGVRSVHAPPAGFVADCLDAVIEDCPPAAVKTGMLFDAAVIEAVVARLRGGAAGAVVVDPVMIATSGDRLLRDDAVGAMRRLAVPVADLVTPNIDEAEVLAGREIRTEEDIWDAAARIRRLGARAVLIKGGHLTGPTVVDCLQTGSGRHRFERSRIDVPKAHGTGCTLSAAIAAALARGLGMEEAVRRAGDWLHAALAAARPVGRGAVPLDHTVLVPGLDP